MTARQALVTIALGEDYIRLFQEKAEPGWKTYCDRHGFDLVVFEIALDDSPRAQARSPSWQKCLILERPELAPYRQICWVDADIMIRPESPSVFAGVPEDMVGGVDAYAVPNFSVYTDVLARMYDSWRSMGARFLDCPTPESFYTARGLPGGVDSVMHAGVMVASPKHHAGLFRHVYDAYEDVDGKATNYEWGPMSLEVMRRGLAHWIDYRFNLILSDQIEHHYRFLHRNLFAHLLAPGQESTAQALQKLVFDACLKEIYANGFFMHFCGLPEVMRGFDPS
ncbi:MAG: hypothetical protein EPN26_11665 [Rhodospirillales bacterium]|nr:MAG: hypothetical protein EPN26_11665 [Rhodospirillales bacterium]